MIDFSEAASRKARSEKRSVVDTATMTLFFLLFYFLIRLGIGGFAIGGLAGNALIVIGTAIVAAGTAANIVGRFSLGKNWANQVKIYRDQTLVTKGVYSFVRHPLYASLIWMFYGACLVHPNYAAFLANTFIFIPFMHYRAKQEEDLLAKRFKGYTKYQKEVGMLFPKIRK
jgi:protein-S-isoprenylcysteine O-methyltransferase Ste14